jgi:sec-independent protein translocase protein TatA
MNARMPIFQNIGPTELIIILVIILIIFGPKNLPKIGQALGKGIKEFKDAAKGLSEESDEESEAKKPQQQDRPPTDKSDHPA